MILQNSLICNQLLKYLRAGVLIYISYWLIKGQKDFKDAGADAGFVKRGGRVSKFVKRGGRMADIARKRAEFA